MNMKDLRHGIPYTEGGRSQFLDNSDLPFWITSVAFIG
jgi:hypothetical protein